MKIDMKKIAIIIPDFQIGGMPKVASRLIKLLKKEYKITLIIINNDTDILYETYGIKVIMGLRKANNTVSKLFLFRKRYLFLKKCLKKNNFDLTISFGVLANVFNAILMKKRAILTEHNVKSVEDKQWGLSGKAYEKLIKITYPLANKVIAVFHGVQEDLEFHFGLKNVMTIYNPVDLSDLKKRGEKKLSNDVEDIFQDKKVILFVGRLEDTKQPISLVRIFADLCKQNVDTNLVIVGEGVQFELLKNTIIRKKLEHRVFLLGRRDDVLQLMRNSFFTVLISKNEGLPNVLIESISQGTPVISTDIVSG
ncbi:glycosyltransferase, partial [Oenococcus oeni]